MQVMVSIPNECKEFADNIGKVAIEEDDFDNFATCMMTAVRVGTVFPENATNGDMLKALFPDSKVNDNMTSLGVSGIDMTIYTGKYRCFKLWFPHDWWNAPYSSSTVAE